MRSSRTYSTGSFFVFCTLLFFAGALNAQDKSEAKGLGHWSPIVREAEAIRIAKTGNKGIAQLKRALKAKDFESRHAALVGIQAFAKATKSKSHPDWRALAVTVGRLLTNDPHFWVRREAANTLGLIKNPVSATVLVKATSDSEPWVVAAAVSAISKLPLQSFKPNDYLKVAAIALKAPQSQTRESGVKMVEKADRQGAFAIDAIEASIGTLSHDSMFADRPRVAGIKWIAKFDKRKAASLANDLLMENRWGHANRCAKLLPFLKTLKRDAAPARESLTRIANDPKHKHAAQAKTILNSLTR